MNKFLKWLILLLIVLMILILFYENVMAESDISSSVSIYKTIPSDPENIVQSGHGFQAKFHYKNIYLYASKDKNLIRFGGQGGIDVDLTSAGIGFQNKINDNFSFFFDVGWYHPKHDTSNQAFPTTTLSEGLWIYLNNELEGSGNQLLWDYYTIEYHGSIGGKIGVSYQRPIFKNICFNISTAYRYLQLGEMIKGKNYGDQSLGWWEFRQDRDFSGWIVNAAIVVKF